MNVKYWVVCWFTKEGDKITHLRDFPTYMDAERMADEMGRQGQLAWVERRF